MKRSGTKRPLRLDWFLPAIRYSADGNPRRHSRWRQILSRIVPTNWLSDYRTKQRGLIRRVLRRLGITWTYSPWRRVFQGISLALFLYSFIYVCWPYTAKPAPPPRQSVSWELNTWDQSTGELELSRSTRPTSDDWVSEVVPSALNKSVYIVGQRAPFVDEPVSIGPWDLNFANGAKNGTGVAVDRLKLSPQSIPPERLGAMLEAMSSGTKGWELWDDDPHRWPSHYADDLARKERIPAELFLTIDPLVSLSTAVAAKNWVWSLSCAIVILLICVFVPRGFCGYLCPLGTLIDLFDWGVTGRVTRFRVPGEGWWVHLKYYLLLGSLISACFGILVTGVVAAIPVVTRGLLFLLEPLQIASLRGVYLVPHWNGGHWISISLFVVVLCLGFLRPRFWCKYVCPSGALFSLGNLGRLTERKVESSCIHCNKCVEVCPFDAIKPDYTTRVTDCTWCQTCGGVCPTHAIKFVERGNIVELKILNDPPTYETSWGRRGFMSALVGSASAIGGSLLTCWGIRESWAGLDPMSKGMEVDATGNADNMTKSKLPVRPPGSVPEREFLQMCIRCGECFKACPNNVLQPLGFQQGLEGLWTPYVHADWAGCESSCNACGQVCPTGAIRPLPLDEKRFARMGLAIVNPATCLPWANREACQLCVDECHAAGYHAIEFTQVHTEVDDSRQPIDGSGFLAPVVRAEACVGCGICQTRCYGINVEQKKILSSSAIVITAGGDQEDRFLRGSYADLHRQRLEAHQRASHRSFDSNRATPSQLKVVPSTPDNDIDDDPFGLHD